jgi:AraC family transcriptional regulator
MIDDHHRPSPHRPVYIERVNAAVDHIEQHLGEELSLEKVADVAHFSPYHFHRIFGLLVGEPLGRFVGRLRMERAATLLIQQPDRPVADIGAECGIPNPSTFSRAFRDTFGMSATRWRAGGGRGYENETVGSSSEPRRDIGAPREGFGITGTRSDGGRRSWEIACGPLGPTVVEIVDVPDLDVAYVRHIGPYQGAAEVFADVFSRLMTWAEPRALIDERSWIMAVYHDNPGITDDEKLRLSACVDVPAEVMAEGEIGRMSLAGGPCAVARFELGVLDYPDAWFAVAGGWLPDSGYEPDDRLPFERYPVGVSTTSEHTEVVDICIPVRPLRRY